MARAARTHGVPLGVLYAVGLSETGRKGVLNPYALNVDGKTVLAADLRDAVAQFREAKSKGAKLVDLGCMQINHRYHGDHFASVEAMFDPARNVDYAARFLKELRAREGNWTMAVARYNAGPNNTIGAAALYLQRDRQPRGERLRILDQQCPHILQRARVAVMSRPPQRQPHARKRASNENYFERRGSMSLYGVMRTGGSGMNAQSNKLSTVADNIANVNTTGYKRASTEFSSLVLQSGTGNYNSGSVETHVRYAISDPGTLNFTTSATDLAIQGNGFFVVTDAGGTPFLTRAGSFVPDGQGNLVNAAGFYLMGYNLKNGPPNVVSNGLSGLEVVNIAQTALQGNPSTKATVSANLDANAAITAGAPPSRQRRRSSPTTISATR